MPPKKYNFDPDPLRYESGHTIMDCIMKEVLELVVDIPFTTEGIPRSKYFGVFVTIRRSRTSASSKDIHGCRGFISRTPLEAHELARHAISSAHSAAFLDSRKDDFNFPLTSDPDAIVEVDFMEYPYKLLTDNIYDPVNEGLLYSTDDTRFTTYLPNVFTNETPLDYIQNLLIKKSGEHSKGNFSKYKIDQISTTLIKWISHSQSYFKTPFCANISPVQGPTDVRTTAVLELCNKPSNPDSAQAMAMVKHPTESMITTMKNRLKQLKVDREFEWPEIELALSRLDQFDGNQTYFGAPPASVFQWNWDCQLMETLHNIDTQMCLYAKWFLDNKPGEDAPWNYKAVSFEGTRACLNVLQRSSNKKCQELILPIKKIRLELFIWLDKHLKTTGILKTRPDLTGHFIEGIFNPPQIKF